MAAQGYSLAPWLRVSIVMPTLNEARNLPHVLRVLPSGTYEVIIVDAHSKVPSFERSRIYGVSNLFLQLACRIRNEYYRGRRATGSQTA
jgi:glycosyltransferase involved in cell wall biosynthesis